MSWNFSLLFSSRCFEVPGLMFSLYPFWINFCVCCKITVERSLFYMWMSSFPKLCIKETILSLLCVLGILVKDLLTIYLLIHFSALYFGSLVYMFLFMSVLCCFSYCSFEIHFENRKCGASSFVFIFQDCVGYLESLWLHRIVRNVFLFLYEILEFCSGSHWICKLLLGV